MWLSNVVRITCPYKKTTGLEVGVPEAQNPNIIPIVCEGNCHIKKTIQGIQNVVDGEGVYGGYT